MKMSKSIEAAKTGLTTGMPDPIGRSYYAFCIEQALANIKQARVLVFGDIVDENHELPRIEDLLQEALEAT